MRLIENIVRSDVISFCPLEEESPVDQSTPIDSEYVVMECLCENALDGLACFCSEQYFGK